MIYLLLEEYFTLLQEASHSLFCHSSSTPRSSYDTSASILLNRLNWENLSTQRKKLKATLMFKIIKGLSPAYLRDLFSIRNTP